MAWDDAQVNTEERAALVAAVAAVDVSGLSKSAAREAKALVVRKIPGGKGLNGQALSGLFCAAGGAKGGPRLFFSPLRVCLRPQRASAQRPWSPCLPS